MKFRKGQVQQPQVQWQKQSSTGKTKVKVSAGMIAMTGLKAGPCNPGHPQWPHC